jgi:hypothetical protein
MLLSFVVLLFYSLVYVVLGSIFLALVPALRLTLLNLIVFVLGAWVGGLAFLLTYVNTAPVGFDKYPDAVRLVGAIATGTLLVWLKMRFFKTPNDSRIL